MMPDLALTQWIAGVLCALLVGFSKTGVVGLGIVAVPIMAGIFPPRESTGILLPMLVVGDIVAVTLYRRHALDRSMWRTLLRLLPWVALGLGLGYVAMDWVTDRQMSPILGGLILGLLVLQFVRKRAGDWMDQRLPHTWWFGAICGFLAGLATMLANAAGPITVMYFLARGLPKREFVVTGAWFYLIVNLIKMPMSATLGLVTAPTLAFDLAMVPIILVGAVLGYFVLSKMPQKVFDGLVLVIAVAASLRLIVQWP
jgi:uncharacterized protein